MAKPYSDIGKEAKDILANDFPGESGAIKFTTNGKKDQLTVKNTFEVKDSVVCRSENKYEISKQLELTGKLSTTKDYSAIITAKVVDGFKVEATTTSSEKKGYSGSASVTYTHPSVVGKVSVNTPFELKGSEAGLEVAFNPTAGVLLGVSTGINLDNLKSSKAETAVSYTGGKYTLALKGLTDATAKKTLLGASYFHRVNDDVKVGIDGDYDLSNKDKPVVNCSAAVEYKVNSTVVKAKVKSKCSDVRFGFGVKCQFNPFVTVFAGTDVNVRSLLGHATGAPHNYGAEFKFDL